MSGQNTRHDISRLTSPAGTTAGHGSAERSAAVEATDRLASQHGDARRPLGVSFWIAVGWIAIIIILAVFANLLPLANPTAIGVGPPMAGPSFAHLLGTDELGRDLLSRIIYGARVSLVIGFASIAIGAIVGGGLGLLAGYMGGPFDSLSNALAYVILAFPPLLLLLAVAAFSQQTMLKLVLEFAFLSIAPLFRVTRAATMSVSSKEFVQAAVASGARRTRILLHEVLPGVLPSVISYALLGIALVIVGEGSLAFLGLSIALPAPSWGNMIAEGRTFLSVDPWISLFPSIAMFSLLLALNLAADKLREHFEAREGQL